MDSRNMLYVLAIMVLVLVLGICAQGIHREHYPNPMRDPEGCGRRQKSYLCDPDKVLKPEEADQLDRELERVMNETRCPCSSNSCASRKYGTGYKIAVALMNKMPEDKFVPRRDGDDDLDHNMEKARIYTYTLLQNWNLGSCEEEIIIFYSDQDNVLYTMTRENARKKLKNNLIGKISMLGRGKFGSNNFEALVYLISNYRDVLMDKYEENVVLKPKTAALTDSSAFSLASTSCVILCGLLAAVLTV